MDVTLVIKSYLDEGSLNMEGLYGSRSLLKLKSPLRATAPNEEREEM